MTTIQPPLIELPARGIDDSGEPVPDETPATSSARELLLGLLLGIGALASVHVVLNIALMSLRWLGLLP